MSARSAHTKSRNGCSQCKRRHIKCDLQPPICTNCKKRGQLCDYQALNTEQSGSGILTRGVRPDSVPTPRVFVPGHMHAFGLLDVSPATLLSLYDSEGVILNDEFAHAVSSRRQPFLEHNLLAIGALYSYVRSSEPSPDLYTAALFHHTEASRLFRRSIRKITESNWIATLGFAISVVVFHLNDLQGHGSNTIMETMRVLRNTAGIAQLLTPWYSQSHIRTLIDSQKHECESSDWVAEVLSALDVLERLDNSDGLNRTKEATYRGAIDSLRQWVLNLDGYPRVWIHFLWWPANVSAGYLKLLTQNEACALVVFLHWCAIMTGAPKRWFLDGWATRIAAPVTQALRPEWDAHIAWPGRILGLNCSSGVSARDLITSSAPPVE